MENKKSALKVSYVDCYIYFVSELDKYCEEHKISKVPKLDFTKFDPKQYKVHMINNNIRAYCEYIQQSFRDSELKQEDIDKIEKLPGWCWK